MDLVGVFRTLLRHSKGLLEPDNSPLAAAPPSVSELYPGDNVGERYLIIDRIGEGGLSRVYKAKDQVTGSHVAVKCYKVQELGEPETRRLMECERESLSSLSGRPGVPTLVDLIHSKTTPLIVMSYIDGSTLHERLKEQSSPFAPDDGLSLDEVSQMLLMLAACHEAGVVHGDVKPSNWIVGLNGDLWLIDFGTGLANSPDCIPRPGGIIGTPGYIAPELLLGDLSTAKADIYALGSTIAALVTRSRPGMPPLSDLSGYAAERTELVRTSGSRHAELLARLCSVMLSPDPSNRPSCRDLLELLRGAALPTPTRPAVPRNLPGRLEQHLVDGGMLLIELEGGIGLYSIDGGQLGLVRSWRIADNWRIALVELLVDLFSDYRELRGHFPKLIRDILPGADISLSDGAHSTVEILLRHGQVDTAFFRALVESYPRRELEIRAVMRRWRLGRSPGG